MSKKTVGVILASGVGERFGSSFPKQFMSLNGKTILQHSIDKMYETGIFDEIICTLPPNAIVPISFIVKIQNVNNIILGGETRTETILNVLNACSDKTGYIVFHDSVRPFIDKKHFIKGLELLKTKNLDFLVTGQPITDALISTVDLKGQNRKNFKLCQTPEFFYYPALKHRISDLQIKENNYTYIAQTFTNLYKGDILDYIGTNLKITYEQDLFLAEQLMKYTEVDESTIPYLKHKNILLLGASGDIGKAIYTILVESGAKVTAPTHKEFDITKSILPNSLNTPFDCVIHSAGAYITDKDDILKNYDNILNTNFKSVLNIVEFSKQCWLKNGGNIILLGSTCASFGRPGISLYSASKSALNTFVEAYHGELLKQNIKVNVIAPAKVQGKLQSTINPSANQEEMISPARLAEIISHYVDTNKTGQIVYVRYGLENKK